MTIVLGIVCSGGIVMASDSETTTGEEVRRDAGKLHIVQTKNAGVIVGEAGSQDSSQTVLNFLRDLSATQAIEDYKSFARLAQDAVRLYRKQLIDDSYHCPPAKLNDLIFKNGLDCELMICHYAAGVPCMHTVELGHGICWQKDRKYWSIGAGKHIANFLLGRFDFTWMDIPQAVCAAMYVVEEVKNSVNGCGGDTHICTTMEYNQPVMLDRESIDKMVRVLTPAMKDMDKQRMAKIDRIIQEVSSNYPTQSFGDVS